MIKKISSHQLCVGMFVHEFCGSWMDHPFWRSKFTIRTAQELQRVIDSKVVELWIDTSKGADVQGGTQDAAPSIDREQVDAEIERRLEEFITMPAPLHFVLGGGESSLDAAAALVRRSVPRIASMFNDVRLGKTVQARECEDLVDEITDSVSRNPGALISVARLKRHDDYTYMHSVAVCGMMIALGRQMELKPALIKRIGLAGMLHDLGKAMVPLDILNKPGKLTDAEFAVMKTHPEQGHALLVEGGSAGPVVLDVCLHHHEKFDGTGYPHGLAGDTISMVARMGAVCDVYDAITSVRPYNNGWDPGEALRRMAQWAGHFDPAVFQAFVKTVGIYPVGTLVKLQSSRLAVVTAQNAEALLTPKVKVFYDVKRKARVEPHEINLANRLSNDKVLGCESPENWNFQDLDLLWGAPPGP
jgi:HD-GYP domain-containing protein (c-di-GMP phosphodiesterase class II)